MKYVITRGKCQAWPSREYTVDEVLARARRDDRIVRDGYGRPRLRSARKLVVSDRKFARSPVILIAVQEPEKIDSSRVEPPKITR